MNDTLPTPWLVWPIALPLLGAVAALVWPRRAAWAGLLTAGLLLAAGAGGGTQLARHGELVHEAGGWAAPLGIALRADGLAAVMLLMVTAVGLTVSVYATGYFGAQPSSSSSSLFSIPPRFREPAGFGDEDEDEDEVEHERGGFWTLWLFLWAALNALFLSRDLFNLYVTLELLGLAAVALVALAGAPVAVGAAMRYLLVSLLGSLAFLLGVALVYAAHGTLDLPQLGQRLAPGPGAATALGLMTAGLLMKTALCPLHFWLRPAHANAPAPVSALLSALVV
ncbi:MAG TPA: proton-conducting transporter membrane subunit, partial [Verrucomicrobiota bacterium]|nr:proton-conducting transporter membrane subunit [Verrucomicrobiota bacterium]